MSHHQPHCQLHSFHRFFCSSQNSYPSKAMASCFRIVKTNTSPKGRFPKASSIESNRSLAGWIQTLARLDGRKTNDQYRERRKLPLFQRNEGKFSWTFSITWNFSTWPFSGKFRKNYRNPTSWVQGSHSLKAILRSDLPFNAWQPPRDNNPPSRRWSRWF